MRMAFFAIVAAIFLLPCALPAQDSKENSDFRLAVSLYDDKMYDLALEQFKQFTNLYPNSSQSVDARYYVGLLQFKLKKYDEARYSFQNFALSYPDNIKAPDAWMNVAEVYLALNNLHEAALAFERVKTFSPKSKQAPIALMKAAENYTKAGETGEAKRSLRVLTQEYSDPDVVLPAHLEYASLLMIDKDFEGARAECRKVTEATKDPNLKSMALLLTAQAYDGLEKSKEEESALNELIKGYKNSKGYDEAQLMLGMLKQKSGNLADAISIWQTLANDTLHTSLRIRQNALMSLGEAATLEGEYRKSLQEYEKAGEIKSRRTGEAWFRAGEIAERLGDSRTMAKYYAKSVNDSNSVIDRRALLIAATKGASSEKDYVEAVRLADEYRDRYPGDLNLPRVLLESADLCASELKDYRKAIDLYEEILDKYSQSLYADDALYGLGKALHLSGSLDESVRMLQSIENRFPSSDLIDRANAEAQYITLFELKNKDTGLEKLALLVGDVIAQQSKAELAYRLAEIYFHELKDYEQAASQYQFSLNSEIGQERRPAAWFNIARAFEYLNLRDRLAKENGAALNDAGKAIAAYDSLLAKFPESNLADDAALSRFNLRLQLASTTTELRKVGTNFLSNIQNARSKDRAYLVLGNAYATGKNLEDAALTYRLILDQYPQSPSAPEASFQLGKSLMGLAEQDSGSLVLTRFLDANPNHPRSAEAAFLLAQYAATTGHADRANQYYDLLEKKYYYSNFAVDLVGKRGNASFIAHDYAKAAELYIRQIHLIQTDYFVYGDVPPDMIYRTAYACEKAGKPREAERYYAGYITRVKDSDTLGQVYYALASIARSDNNTELATKYLQQSLRYAKPFSDQATGLSLEAAELLFHDGHYVEAIARYSEVEQQTKNDSLKLALQTRVIVCYYRLDNVKEGDKRSSLFAKVHPQSAFASAEFELERGKYFLRKDDPVKALGHFENILQNYPHTPVIPDALFWTGKTNELTQKPQQAIALYDSVLNQYPKSEVVPQAELSLGNIYYNLEQWDAAVRYYRTLVDSESRTPDLLKYAMNNLALAYKQLKLYDAAMGLDRKYIDRFPDDDEVINKKIDIAVLYQNLEFYDQSILQLESLLDAGNPGVEAELRYYIGEGHFYKGSYQQAILEFLKVPYLVTKKGTSDWISPSYYMAGQSYEKMSKFDLAMAMYKKIVESKDTATEFKTAAQREITRVQSILSK